VCGGGRAEPIPQELLNYRRSWSPAEYEYEPEPAPESERASDTPPFGTPVVPAQGDPWAASPPPGPSIPAPTAPTTPAPMYGAPTAQTAPTAPTAPTVPTGPGAGAPPQPTVASGPVGGSAAGEIRDRLIELDDLRRRGIISEEEFAAKKAELLSRI
jgi:hypothetical protein